ncbi:hypothetical protein D3C81_1434820 [compost metagenome]
MNENKLTSRRTDHLLDTGQHRYAELGQALPRLHQIKIIIRLNPEYLKHLIEHLPVLSRDTYNRSKTGSTLQYFYKWCHLNCLRPRTEHNEHTNLFHIYGLLL